MGRRKDAEQPGKAEKDNQKGYCKEDNDEEDDSEKRNKEGDDSEKKQQRRRKVEFRAALLSCANSVQKPDQSFVLSGLQDRQKLHRQCRKISDVSFSQIIANSTSRRSRWAVTDSNC